MGTHKLNVGPLPDDPLAAAAQFYAAVLPLIASGGGQDLVLVFPPADYTHRAWRLAAVQELARTHAPLRVNAVASDDAAALAAALEFLTSAGGVTGQYLPLAAARSDSQRADEVIG